MRLKLILVSMLALTASAQKPAAIYVWARDAVTQQHKLVLLGGLLYDAVEDAYVVPTAIPPAPGEQIAAGQGIILTRVPNQPTVISVETAAFVMVVPAPAAGGECKASTPASSQYVFAADASYMYVCVPNSAEPGKWRWGRAPLQFEF